MMSENWQKSARFLTSLIFSPLSQHRLSKIFGDDVRKPADFCRFSDIIDFPLSQR
jgi:hypothetical protein